MTTFDVYINGIQQDFLSETKSVIEKTGKYLNIDIKKIEAAFSASNSNCIFKGITEKEAINHQKMLLEIGVVCIYRPGAQSLGLTLEAIETEEEISVSNCPKCNHELSLEEGHSPKICNACGVLIEKFIEIQKRDEEKEEIKQRLMRTKNSQDSMDLKRVQEEVALKRRQQLEKEVLDENADLNENESKIKNLLLGGLIVIAGVFAVMISTSSESEAPLEESNLIAENEVTNETPANSDISVEGGETLSADSSDGSVQMANGSGGNAASSSQQSMETAYDQSNKVLGAIGLSTEGIENSGPGQGNGSSANGSVNASAPPEPSWSNGATGPSDTTWSAGATGSSDSTWTTGAAESTSTGNTGYSEPTWSTGTTTSSEPSWSAGAAWSAESVEKQPTPTHVTQSILIKDGIDKEAWDRVLLNQVVQKIKSKDIASAYNTSTQLINKSNYINALGQLLSNTGEAKYKVKIIETIEALPASEQIQLFSQATLFQTEKNSYFFKLAEQSWNKLTIPEQQLSASLALASSFFKTGNVKLANSYFSKTPILLKKIKVPDQQFDAHIAIGLAYSNVGRKSNAIPWLNKAKKILVAPNSVQIQKLVNSFIAINEVNTGLGLINKFSALEQDKYLYNAINTALDNNSLSNAEILTNTISTAPYKALAYILLSGNQHGSDLISAEALLTNRINNPLDQIIISSRLAQSYAIQNNREKVDHYLRNIQKQINLLPSDLQKDQSIKVAAINFARLLRFDISNQLVLSIQTPSEKFMVTEEVQRLKTNVPMFN